MSDELGWNYKPINMIPTPDKQEETSKEVWLLIPSALVCVPLCCADIWGGCQQCCFQLESVRTASCLSAQALATHPNKPGLKSPWQDWQACWQRYSCWTLPTVSPYLLVLIPQWGCHEIQAITFNTRCGMQEVATLHLWYLLLWGSHEG